MWLVACKGDETQVAEQQSVIPAPPLGGTPAPGARVNPRLLRRFKQVASQRPAPPSSPEMVSLGRKLWFDGRLSKSGDISCNSCHTLATYGVDGKTTSTGIHEQLGRRNSPTVYNSAEHFVMFWDGRASDAEAQAIGPIQNPVEMGMTDASVVKTLAEIPGYVGDFSRAFPSEGNPISLSNVGRAIGAFERGLVTRSRWDDYLEGKESALSDAEVDGLRLFVIVWCMV
jgi:cytochrome c peroxidase